MLLTKKNIILIVVAAFVAVAIGLGGLFGGSYLAFAKEKRAMIILPGLFGSGLYDTATGEYIWDNFEGIEDVSFSTVMNAEGLNMQGLLGLLLNPVVSDEIIKLLANEGAGTPDSLLNMIGMETSGEATVSTVERVPWTDQSRWRYGVINAQKDMWESLEERYGDMYDVQVFNYDFRKDTRENAVILEDYINEMKYKEVILLAHSNGGPVVATYLARSEENRKKVKKFVAYNSPLLGSASGIGILENTKDMINGVKDILTGPVLGPIADKVDDVFEKQFLKLTNMWTPYQLLPSYEMFLVEHEGEQAGYYLDGERMNFETQEELWQFYCTRPWAKIPGTEELRPPVAQWLDSRNAMYVTLDDGSKVFSTTLVDTTYVNGNGISGGYKTYFVTDPITGDVNIVPQMENTTRGDGTVTSVSATAGYADPENIRYFEGSDHYAILYDFEGVAEAISYEILDEAVINSLNVLEKIWYEDRP